MKNKNSFLLYSNKRDSENNRKTKEIKLNHYRAIIVDFLPPTDTKGERIVLRDTTHKKRKIIAYDYSQAGAFQIAIKYLLKQGIKTKSYYYDSFKNYYVILTDNFEMLDEFKKQ